MKKLTTFILAIIYFSFSSGATVYAHYCMGEFVSFSFSDSQNQSCQNCGMDKHSAENTCCKDTQVTAESSDAHIGNDYYEPLVAPLNDLTPYSFTSLLLKGASEENSHPSYPPLRFSITPLQYHILFHNIRI